MNIRTQQGLSMIEVLVALFILAIGIMGQMAMQMTSLASSQSSYYRSQAASIANDLADRVRFNPDGAAHTTTNYDEVDIDSESNIAQPSCHSSGCGHADQVLLDLYEIQRSLQKSIPSGSLKVERVATTESTISAYRVTISWATEDRAGFSNSAEVNKLIMDFGI